MRTTRVFIDVDLRVPGQKLDCLVFLLHYPESVIPNYWSKSGGQCGLPPATALEKCLDDSNATIDYGEYTMSANQAETEQAEDNGAELPPKKTTARRKKAAVKSSPAKKPAEKASVITDKTAEEMVESMKEIVRVQLGVYGTISDEISQRLEKIRAETPKKWRKLEKRGEKVQRDLEKAQSDLKKKLKKAQKDLQSSLEKAQSDIQKKVRDISP